MGMSLSAARLWQRYESCESSRRTDPLPPSIGASPYRARPSGAALPLCEGENGVFSPLQRGRRELSERGGQFGD